MTRSPDMPCASCGNLMWRSSTTLPEGQAMCRPCRRKATPPAASSSFVPEVRSCAVCGRVFETHRPRQVYCNPECRAKSHSWPTQKASSTERGYGNEHRVERKRWAKVVDAGQAQCCICGHHIEPGTPWHLDHTPDRTGYRGAACAGCNIRDGAKRGKQRSPR